MLMKKDLLALNGKFLYQDVCAFGNSYEFYSSLLISFMEFMKQVYLKAQSRN